jgi:pyrimidine-nucleoside phosphorylase
MATNRSLIDELGNSRTEEAMARVVAAARERDFDADEVHRLAQTLGRSGRVLEASDHPGADLASTGGPGSLSTLLCPLYLAARGFDVPKLGVPGRPAGGVDVLAQLPGYRVSLDTGDISRVLADCGYAHFLAGALLAPLDAALFRYRQASNAQDVPALAAASLLAKKIACGIQFAGLDVRVAAHGNFGKDFGEAARAARTFCDAARVGGIRAVAVLTDARTPYQPFIGRGEALLALSRIFSGQADPWLTDHDDRCRLMAGHVAALASGTARADGEHRIDQVFARNVQAQGSSMDAFAAKVEAVAKEHRHELRASDEGFFRLDLASLRSVFVRAHSATNSVSPFPDELGLILLARPGAHVRRGDILASVRASDALWPGIRGPLGDAFHIAELLDYAPGVEEIVRA